MDCRSRDQKPGALPHNDLRIGLVQPQHVSIDDLAGDHKTGQAAFLVDAHFGNRSFQRRLHLAGETDLHRFFQRFAILTQQFLPLFGGADPCILPGKARDDLAHTAIQCRFRL